MAQKIQQLQLYKLPFVFIISMGWLMKKSFIYGPSKSNIVGVQKYMKLFHLNYYYNPFTENLGNPPIILKNGYLSSDPKV